MHFSQDIEAALDIEEAALSQMHRTVAKQVTRLELEERMLKLLQDRLKEEVAQQTGNAPNEGNAETAEGAPPANRISGDQLDNPDLGNEANIQENASEPMEGIETR